MTLAALAALAGWLFYSWSIAIALTMMCGVVSLFYAGAITGPADQKVERVFAVMVLAMTLVMVGIISQCPSAPDDAPRLCNRVEC